MALKRDGKNTFVDDQDPLIRDLQGDRQFQQNIVNMARTAQQAGIQDQKEKLALQDNLATNQIRVGDADRDFNRPLMNENVKSTQLANAHKVTENDIYNKTGMRIADTQAKSLELGYANNEKFSARERQLGLDSGVIANQHLQRQGQLEAEAFRLNSLNKGGQAFTEAELARKSDETTDSTNLARLRAMSKFSPFAWNTGSGDVRQFNRAASENLGDSPNNIFQDIAETIPGVAHGKAYNLRSRIKQKYEGLAKPK